MEKSKIYWRNKSQFTTEQAALDSVCKKENLQAEQLTADHSEKQFRWTLKAAGTGTASKQFPFGLHTVERTGADNDLQNAKRAAMEHFKTFEANIKRVESEEDETHFVFTKVRG